MGIKLYLTVSKSKLLDTTSIEEDVKATEYDWETEKCILITSFPIMLYFLTR